MNKTRLFQLIEGTFSPEEANRILGAMVKSKIDCHTLERHSHSERSHSGKARSEERLEELRELNASLKEFFETAAATERKLKTSGTIEIGFAD